MYSGDVCPVFVSPAGRRYDFPDDLESTSSPRTGFFLYAGHPISVPILLDNNVHHVAARASIEIRFALKSRPIVTRRFQMCLLASLSSERQKS